MNNILSELSKRGLLFQFTGDQLDLNCHLETERTVYIGFDPTSDSLHIGSLLPLITLKRFKDCGHKIIVLIGGATGSIGDPTGKNCVRNQLSDAVLTHNVEQIINQIDSLISPNIVRNNIAWWSSMNLLNFFTNIGSKFSVNKMLSLMSVKSRMESETGITFQEFSYPIFQAFDFTVLKQNDDCSIQLGGSDQWGNISVGIDLGHKMGLEQMFGITFPLLTKSDGTKFGKTESGNIWLDSNKTPVFDFYNFWINVSDDDVESLLKMLTFIPVDEINDIVDEHKQFPHLREAQKILAAHMTQFVHGDNNLELCVSISNKLFSDELLSTEEFLFLIDSNVPSCYVNRHVNIDLCELMLTLPSVNSKGEAMRLIKQNAISIKGEKVTSRNIDLGTGEQFFLLKRGKKEFLVIEVN